MSSSSTIKTMPSTSESMQDALLYKIHHIFLPPELPQQNDANDSHEWCLAETVYFCLRHFRYQLQPDARIGVGRCIRMIDRMIRLRDGGGFIDAKLLEEQIKSLEDAETLAVHIRCQNAGLLITSDGPELRFESFELLAPDQDVVNAIGRIKRQFPGTATSIDRSLADDSRFRQVLAKTIMQLDQTADVEMDSIVEADNSFAIPPGPCVGPDTPSPRLVSGMLMAVLRGLGRGKNDVPGISKRSREEVLLQKGTSPWRRSPLWLMIRVSLQLILEPVRLDPHRRADTTRNLKSLYKDFMVYLMSYVLYESLPVGLSHDVLFVMTTKISRRLLKLGSTEEKPGFPRESPAFPLAQEVLRDAKTFLNDAWKDVQEKAAIPLDMSPLATLDFERDTIFQLPSLRKYVEGILKRASDGDEAKTKDRPGHPFRRNEERKYFPRTDFAGDKEFQTFELIEFERSVEEFLGGYGRLGTGQGQLVHINSASPDVNKYDTSLPGLGQETPAENRILPEEPSLWYHRALLPNEIRLLRFSETSLSDSLDCSLEYFLLDKTPKFRVLSYGGDITNGKAWLKLNSHSLPITRGLYSGLRQICTRYGEDEDFYLWTNVICINHSDLNEKSQEVMKMRAIYSSAMEVLVWAVNGDPSETDMDELTDFVFETASSLTENDVEEDGDFSSNWSDSFKRSLKTKQFTRQEFELCIVQLANNPWFSQVWAVQEVALSTQSVVLMAGPCVVELDKFTKLMSAWKASSEWKSPTLDTALDRPLELMRIRQSRKYLPAKIEEELLVEDLKSFVAKLQQSLKDTASFTSSLAQDKIYGLLGLINVSLLPEHLVPDYRLDFADVFRQYARLIYEQSPQVTLLQRFEAPGVVGVPSWVPDFRCLTFPDESDPEPSTSASLKFSDDGLKIVALGALVAKVAAVFPRRRFTVSVYGRGVPFPVSRAILTTRSNRQKEVLDRECGVNWKNKLSSKSPSGVLPRLSSDHQAANSLVDQMTRRSDMSQDYFLTFNGCVGICSGVLEGDSVAVLMGSNRPIILRHQQRAEAGTSSDMECIGSCALSGKFGIPTTYSKSFFSKFQKTKFLII
ncbi:hypothetical protein BU24DRAFT_91134 [Aaosphaeria arxii CBS 175.79]|uniref:Uncharacterized protein n=1 Tax=Aaosphaeria arxii CBS 175.79 TaxID=1450172 RepID=A0A6A5X8J5_9PLEO|nr:uncharacterized protein BU24DRAFT_91134 [Aaosphaeria arxii CBS 175.79]KAF2009127.1 hypothetical protein BU24DRAFT_91134 [Aaosphaeria arxii CBS 175.79]